VVCQNEFSFQLGVWVSVKLIREKADVREITPKLTSYGQFSPLASYLANLKYGIPCPPDAIIPQK
jgi:hypothetical protein